MDGEESGKDRPIAEGDTQEGEEERITLKGPGGEDDGQGEEKEYITSSADEKKVNKRETREGSVTGDAEIEIDRQQSGEGTHAYEGNATETDKMEEEEEEEEEGNKVSACKVSGVTEDADGGGHCSFEGLGMEIDSPGGGGDCVTYKEAGVVGDGQGGGGRHLTCEGSGLEVDGQGREEMDEWKERPIPCDDTWDFVEYIRQNALDADSKSVLSKLRGGIQSRINAMSSEVSNVPKKDNGNLFAGERFIKDLRENHQGKITVLYGPEGCGKSFVAQSFANEVKEEIFPGGMHWLNVENDESLRKSARFILSLLGKPAYLHFEPTEQIFGHLLDLSVPWLLVFDNLDRIGHLMKEEINHFLQKFQSNTVCHGSILITTRRNIEDVRCYLGIRDLKSIRFECFTLEEAVKFLCEHTSLVCVPEARQLAETLACLPLALEQAVAYIKVNKCTVEAYLKKYSQRKLQFLNDRNTPETVDIQDQNRAVIFTTCTLNLESIKEMSPSVAKRLHMLCLLDYEAIPSSCIYSAIYKLDGEDMEPPGIFLELMHDFSFVNFDSRNRIFTMQKTIQDIIKEGLNEEQTVEGIVSCLELLSWETKFKCGNDTPGGFGKSKYVTAEEIEEINLLALHLVKLMANITQHISKHGSSRLKHALMKDQLHEAVKGFLSNIYIKNYVIVQLNDVHLKVARHFQPSLPTELGYLCHRLLDASAVYRERGHPGDQEKEIQLITEAGAIIQRLEKDGSDVDPKLKWEFTLSQALLSFKSLKERHEDLMSMLGSSCDKNQEARLYKEIGSVMTALPEHRETALQFYVILMEHVKKEFGPDSKSKWNYIHETCNYYRISGEHHQGILLAKILIARFSNRMEDGLDTVGYILTAIDLLSIDDPMAARSTALKLLERLSERAYDVLVGTTDLNEIPDFFGTCLSNKIIGQILLIIAKTSMNTVPQSNNQQAIKEYIKYLHGQPTGNDIQCYKAAKLALYMLKHLPHSCCAPPDSIPTCFFLLSFQSKRLYRNDLGLQETNSIDNDQTMDRICKEVKTFLEFDDTCHFIFNEIQDYNFLLRDFRDSSLIYMLRSQAYFKLDPAAWNIGSYRNKAMADADKAVLSDKSSSEAYWWRACCYAKMEEQVPAKASAGVAKYLNPTWYSEIPEVEDKYGPVNITVVATTDELHLAVQESETINKVVILKEGVYWLKESLQLQPLHQTILIGRGKVKITSERCTPLIPAEAICYLENISLETSNSSALISEKGPVFLFDCRLKSVKTLDDVCIEGTLVCRKNLSASNCSISSDVNTVNAVTAKDNSTAQLNKCIITNSNIGVFCNEAEVRIKDSLIFFNNLGVSVKNGFLELETTSVHSNEEYGLSVDSDSRSRFAAKTTLFNCRISDNKDSGIMVKSGRMAITECSVINNATGISILDGDMEMRGTKVHDNIFSQVKIIGGSVITNDQIPNDIEKRLMEEKGVYLPKGNTSCALDFKYYAKPFQEAVSETEIESGFPVQGGELETSLSELYTLEDEPKEEYDSDDKEDQGVE